MSYTIAFARGGKVRGMGAGAGGIRPDCLKYTGCPAAFPVVYCMPQGGHADGEDRHDPGLWDFWKAPPPVP
jgi:hypothetical protein